jgi:hypothetical protein
MEPIAQFIRDEDIVSLAGLRSKALVAIWDCRPTCASHGGYFDFGNTESHYSLFNAAVALTGLSDMVSSIDTRLQADATIFHDDEDMDA